jgi:VanZ family protein
MASPDRIIINIRDTAAERDLAQARRTVTWWLAILTVLAVLFCGMFPFDFDIHPSNALSEIHRRFGTTFTKWHLPGDLKQNLVFFFPVGFVLAAVFWGGFRQPLRKIAVQLALLVLCAAALSAVVEFSQVYLISRDPSLADIVSNTIGAVMGLAIYLLCGGLVMRFLTRRLIALRRTRNSRLFAVAAAAWLLIAIVAPILARNISSLRVWDPGCSLLIGNRPDGLRHWDGLISNLWLSSAPIDDDEMAQLLVAEKPDADFHDSLMMAYHFTGVGPYTDASGHCADLVWTANFNHGAVPGTTEPSDLTGVAAIGRDGIPISDAWYLSTDEGGTADACNRIMRTEAFTLVLDLTVGRLNQGDGWPRIFSLSRERFGCNLEVLQEHRDLEFRLHCAAAGEDGTYPDLIVPDIFASTTPQRVIVTYDHGKIGVATDHSGQFYSTQYSPDAWLVWRLYPRDYWRYRIDSWGEGIAASMYRILAMLPIGLLFGALLRILQKERTSLPSQRIFLTVICGAPLLLEVFLHFAAGTTFLWILPIVSLLALSSGVLLILGRLPFEKR